MPHNYRIIFLSLSIFNSSLAIEYPPINIKPLDEPDASEIIHNFINNKQQETAEPISQQQLKEQPSKKNNHSPYVQEKKTLQHIHSEGKDILTITYTSTGPEGLAFLKEKYPDFFERTEEFRQANLPTQKTIEPPLTKIAPPLEKTPQWILESSMNNAPKLLQGIFHYLQSRRNNGDKSQQSKTIPSFHRFILVGSPGTGKTTLARTIAYMLNYPIIFIPATSLLGRFRNQTANNIQECLKECTADGLCKVIIIDELHKLFEHHGNEHADDSQNAAAFWLALDEIEKHNPNIIIIGTAKTAEKLYEKIKKWGIPIAVAVNIFILIKESTLCFIHPNGPIQQIRLILKQ